MTKAVSSQPPAPHPHISGGLQGGLKPFVFVLTSSNCMIMYPCSTILLARHIILVCKCGLGKYSRCHEYLNKP